MNIAYFDNAATTFPKPEEVYTFMDSFYRRCGVNVGRGQYTLASEASALVSDTRERLLNLCKCMNKEIIFTPSATEALNLVLRGISIRDNFNVYISPFEHNAVTRVLHHLEENSKLNINLLAFDKDTFEYDIDAINIQFIYSPPQLVIASHASNVYGIIAPIKAICTLAKRYDATTVVDMCQTMGLIDTDLNNEIIDYAVFAGHKTLYGPFGIAGIITTGNTQLLPLLFGGTGTESANQTMPTTTPGRYEAGSPNIVAIAGLNAALRWIESIGINEIHRKEHENHLTLLRILSQYGNIKIISPQDVDKGIGVVSCVFDGYSSDNIGQVLSERNIAVRAGLHCAPYAHKFLGTFPNGTVRFSCSYYTNGNDFFQLVDALDYINENS